MRFDNRRTGAAILALLLAACSPTGLDTPGPLPIVVEREILPACEPSPSEPPASRGPVPLMDQPGGLYGTGNGAPPDVQRGALRAADAMLIPDGRVVILGIGMSNSRIQFDALAPRIAGPERVLVVAACSGCTLDAWDDPEDSGFRSAARELARAGLTAADVDVVLFNDTRSAREAATADEFDAALAAGRRAWPNATQWILTNRIYAGYEPAGGREPAAHEVGYAIREFVLRHRGESSPAVFWGPDQWANGATPRSDGLTWLPEDYREDMLHPSARGAEKSVELWLRFFESSPLTPWY